MIQLLGNLPQHVVGIVASGQVNASDYKAVIIVRTYPLRTYVCPNIYHETMETSAGNQSV